MKPESIAVALRLSSKQDSKLRAHADVTIPLGDDGTITILGFSVLEVEGRPPKVMVPARKGKQAWFDTVQLSGRIWTLVEEVVLAEYERHTKKAKR
jgi:hypothetical protein